ncbi:MAG: SDR family oxidoreductase [Desulfobacterales bacterium]|nr:SDR family oxidoreductase [Desulfobacterales bacterium]
MSKTALITGATSGIGYELSKVFAKNHYNLVIVSRNREKLDAVAGELSRLYDIQVKVIAKDLCKYPAPQALYNETTDGGIQIDVLVNNAGVGINGRLVDLSAAKHMDLIQLNIASLTILCKLFGADMVKMGSGGILNVASTAAFQAGPFMSAYYASKAYVLMFSEGLSAELKGTDVTVTALCPGPTRTDFFDSAGMKGSKLEKIPFMMTPAKVAEIGFSGLQKGKTIVIPGLVNKILAFSSRLFPRGMITAITSYLNYEKN